jgi:hypothetical protein
VLGAKVQIYSLVTTTMLLFYTSEVIASICDTKQNEIQETVIHRKAASVDNGGLTRDGAGCYGFSMQRKIHAVKMPSVTIDTRLKISDESLCRFLREGMKRGEREINQQIIFMLKFAAAQMSAHDLEPK